MKKTKLTLNEFWLRIIALLTMTFDHVGVFLLNSGYFADNSIGSNVGLVFRIIGRLAFPIFALMLAEGMTKTRNRVKYLERIGVFWLGVFLVECVMAYGFNGKFAPEAEPQAFTDLLVFGLFIFFIESKGWKKALAVLPLAWIVLSYAAGVSETYAAYHQMTSVWSSGIPAFTRCMYSLYGFLIFLGFYYAYRLADFLMAKGLKEGVVYSQEDAGDFRKTKDYRSLVNLLGVVFFLLVNVIFWAIHYFAKDIDPYTMGIQSYSLIAILVLVFYDGKRGYDSKAFRIFEYSYYPVHLAIIAFFFGIVF